MSHDYIEYLGEPYDGEKAWLEHCKWLAKSPEEKAAWHKAHPPIDLVKVAKKAYSSRFYKRLLKTMSAPSPLFEEMEWKPLRLRPPWSLGTK